MNASLGKIKRKLCIVLPAYNEGETLPPLLEAISRAMEEAGLAYIVLVVNDGSTDNTAEVARGAAGGMPVRLVEHPRNMGLAAALRTGLAEAVRETSDEDIIVTMDADNTHPPRLIGLMVEKIDGGYDVVITSRYRKGAKVLGLSSTRKMLSFCASLLFRALLPIRGVRDYTCGYRAYRARAIGMMFDRYGDDFISEQGFSCMVDVLLKMRGHDLRFTEVPLVLRYDLKTGESKMKVARTVFQTLVLILKRMFGSKT
jgi:dolichol-phosphate mannosyltransferase